MRACAYIVGDGKAAAGVAELAERVGFYEILQYKGELEAERQLGATPVLFFLFAPVEDVQALRPVAEAIRFSATLPIRLSPMVHFARTASLETIRSCINMGFDDVIAQPCSTARVGERLGRQLDTQLVFYETQSYFGPDRRNRMPAEAADTRRGAGGQFRRMEIVRDLASGIAVLSDQVQVVV